MTDKKIPPPAPPPPPPPPPPTKIREDQRPPRPMVSPRK